MDSSILYTLPQWGIFLGVSSIIYAWIEKKKIIGLIGSSILVLIGIYSLYAILSNLVGLEYDLSEVLPEEEFSPEDLPVQAKLLPVYWGIVSTGIIALFSLLLEIFNKKYFKTFKVIACILGLALFFMVYGIINS